MIVVNNVESIGKVAFGDLAIGDTYIDCEGLLAIKTHDEYDEETGYGGCIYYHNGEWDYGDENINAKVTPVRTKIIVEGYGK